MSKHVEDSFIRHKLFDKDETYFSILITSIYEKLYPCSQNGISRYAEALVNMILKDYLSASLMLEEQKLEEQASNAQKTADILMSCIEIGILLYRAEFKEVYIKKIRNAYKEKSFHTLVAILDEKLWTKYQLSIDSIEDLRLQAKGLFLADLIVDPQEFKKMQFKILAEKDVEIEKIYKIHLDLQSRQQCLKQHKEFKWASSEAEEIF